MTDISDKRIDDLILWHREREVVERLSYFNAPVGLGRQRYAKIADMHRDTIEALQELAEFRHAEEIMEDEHA